MTAPARAVTVPCPFCATLNRVDMDRVADRPRCGSCGRPILLDRPLAISDGSFDAVITGATVPVMMDAYADWCGPCKIMAPVLDDFAHQRAGDVLVVKLDTDRNPVTSQRFGIRSIPTLVVFRGGGEVGREVGVVPRARLDALLSASSRAPGAP